MKNLNTNHLKTIDMELKDLKTGMLFIQRGGCMAIIMRGTERGDIYTYMDNSTDLKSWGELKGYNENLTYNNTDNNMRYADIVKVYSIGESNMMALTTKLNKRTLLYEREEKETWA